MEAEALEYAIRIIESENANLIKPDKEKKMETESSYTFRKFYIPSRMMGGIKRYIDHGVVPGDFLQAVICNDLQEACGRADEENLRNIPAYIGYFYNEAPAGCWGSKEIMQDWIDAVREAKAKEDGE